MKKFLVTLTIVGTLITVSSVSSNELEVEKTFTATSDGEFEILDRNSDDHFPT